MTQKSVSKHGCAIGIDFGTVNTRVAVFRNGRLKTIPDEDGSPSMASIVSFNDTTRLIGSRARSQLAFNPRNTIFNIKRLVGCRLSDPHVAGNIHFPFKLEELGQELAVSVEFKGETCKFTVVEIVAMILAKAKDNAENYLGTPVTGAVVSVPAYWSAEKRNAILDAGRIADLNIMHLMVAPCASALAQGYNVKVRGIMGERTILICNVGGGSFNTILATIEDGIVETKAIASDTQLGGEDFVSRLVMYMVEEAKKRWKKDITANSRSLRRLRTACELAITALSSANSAHIEIDSLFEGRDFYSLVTRDTFIQLCQDLFRSLSQPIDRVMCDARWGRWGKTQIEEVLLVGGSSRIPRIQQILSDYLGVAPTKTVNPDEAEVMGLAISAAILSGDGCKTLNEVMILEVNPFSLGIDSGAGIFSKLLPRNTTIPTRKGEIYHIQPETRSLHVYEGERQRVKDNILLAKVDLRPLGLGASKVKGNGLIPLECTIYISARSQQSSLKVVNQLTGLSVTMPIHLLGSLDSEALAERGVKAIRMQEEDDFEAERIQALDTLEGGIASLIELLRQMPSPESEEAVESAEKVRHWIEDNEGATADEFECQGEILDEIKTSFLAWKSDEIYLKGLKTAVKDRVTAVDTAGAQTPTDDTPTVKPTAVQPSADEEPPSIEPVAASEVSATQQGRPPRHDSDSLEDLFARARGPTPEPFTDAQFERVSTFLQNTGNAPWGHVPRLYTVLRLIDQVDTMGLFLAQGMNDIWFPFTNATLPPAMALSTQVKFLESQAVVLSKGFKLESDPDRRHVNFSGQDALPFDVVGRLGRGAHGSVNKVVSTISYRQYAQKVFRKGRGLRREDIKSFITELGILKRVQHKHCVELVSATIYARQPH